MRASSRRLRWLAVVTLPAVLMLAATAAGQELLTDTVDPLEIDFYSFTGSGFAPDPASGQLDSDSWSVIGMSEGNLLFGGTRTTGDFARGADSGGGVGTGGIYAFDVNWSGDWALGVQPVADDMNPGTITLRVDNGTGMKIDEVMVLYDLYYNNDQARANSCKFSSSTEAGGAGAYTAVPALDFTSPEAADDLGFQKVERVTELAALALGEGDSLFLRWTFADVSGSNYRDEFALDNVKVMSLTIFADGFESGDPSAWSKTAASGTSVLPADSFVRGWGSGGDGADILAGDGAASSMRIRRGNP